MLNRWQLSTSKWAFKRTDFWILYAWRFPRFSHWFERDATGCPGSWGPQGQQEALCHCQQLGFRSRWLRFCWGHWIGQRILWQPQCGPHGWRMSKTRTLHSVRMLSAEQKTLLTCWHCNKKVHAIGDSNSRKASNSKHKNAVPFNNRPEMDASLDTNYQLMNPVTVNLIRIPLLQHCL